MLFTPSNNPFYNTDNFLHAEQWVLILLGCIFLVLTLAAFAVYFFYSRKKLEEFKQEQLDQYIKENPRRQHIKYQNTGMFVPAWERAKFNAPLILAVLFLALAIMFFTGTKLTTL
ncbi:hypothetical protein ACJA23_02485 [Mycoplasma corogypsi]|uniref:hypothetical protein n=1 Tax=Mycoplasma corogypsi TaxID=2106 RepID=UPI003872FE18